MRKLSILILVLVMSQINYAQKSDHTIPLSAAYVNFNLDGQGVMVSTEYTNNNKLIIEAALSAYTHDETETSLSFSAFFSRRFTYKSGYSSQFGLGTSLINTWRDEDIPPGQFIDEEGSAGRLALTTSIKISPIAWDFRISSEFPMRVFFDTILQASFPEYKFVNTHVIFQLGATYYFGFSAEEI